jgi:hypothetical protein
MDRFPVAGGAILPGTDHSATRAKVIKVSPWSKAWEGPWWQWLVLAGTLAVFGLDAVAYHLSGQPDWRNHLRFSGVAHAVTGVEIFVVLPLTQVALRRHRTGRAARLAADTDPEAGSSGQ